MDKKGKYYLPIKKEENYGSSCVSNICSSGRYLEVVHGLNIYNCCHEYREANSTADCLAKKGIGLSGSFCGGKIFPKMLLILAIRIIVVVISTDCKIPIA